MWKVRGTRQGEVRPQACPCARERAEECAPQSRTRRAVYLPADDEHLLRSELHSRETATPKTDPGPTRGRGDTHSPSVSVRYDIREGRQTKLRGWGVAEHRGRARGGDEGG